MNENVVVEFSDETIADEVLVQLGEVFFTIDKECYVIDVDGTIMFDRMCRDTETLQCMCDEACDFVYRQHMSIGDIREEFKRFPPLSQQ